MSVHFPSILDLNILYHYGQQNNEKGFIFYICCLLISNGLQDNKIKSSTHQDVTVKTSWVPWHASLTAVHLLSRDPVSVEQRAAACREVTHTPVVPNSYWTWMVWFYQTNKKSLCGKHCPVYGYVYTAKPEQNWSWAGFLFVNTNQPLLSRAECGPCSQPVVFSFEVLMRYNT